MWGTQETREQIAVMLEKYADKVEVDELKVRWKAAIENLRKPVEIPDGPKEVAPEEKPKEKPAEKAPEEAAEEPAKGDTKIAE